MTALWIFLGGGFGSLARWFASGCAARATGAPLAGTFFVNITGSLVIGLLAALTASASRSTPEAVVRALLMVGFCGGYTTFSAFSLQTLTLLQHGEMLRAAANAVVSVVACIAATWAGYAAGTWWFAARG